MIKKAFLFLGLLLINFVFLKEIYANETFGCTNRFATLVNPVRGRDLWIDKSINPLKDQYGLIKSYNFPATWLLQYDVLLDKELIEEVNRFDKSQQLGVFLEVSKKFTDNSRVLYPQSIPWYSPKGVFLSAYSQSERRRLIDKLFADFKLNFGSYPKSVGAWWIDSYSLNYMKEKYNINTALIVADQKTTDNYGVWGQWWGVPFYPSKANILTPANDLKNEQVLGFSNKQDVVVIQWAQRDPYLAVGDGPKFSNYSMQANDYIRQGKNTDYFKYLVDIYLDCRNPLGQVTVGLETGSDSVLYFEEYKKQLEALKLLSSLQIVTMENFAQRFAKVYPDFPKKVVIGEDNQWVMTPDRRINEKIKEEINYDQNISFDDYFVAKRDDFLNRNLSQQSKKPSSDLPINLSLIGFLATACYALFKKKLRTLLVCTLFVLASFGLVLRSYSQFGWWVYFGPNLQPLFLYQLGLPIIFFFLFLFFNRFKRLNLWIIPLVFAFDPIIQSFRASYISGKYFLGFSTDALRFVGVSLDGLKLGFVNADFPSYLAAGLLKIDYARIWQNTFYALVIYPLIHLLMGFVLGFIFSQSFRLKKMTIALLIFFFLAHLWMIFNADPFTVQSF